MAEKSSVFQITHGAGADRIVEVGGAGTLQKSCACVAFQGSISTIGFVAGSASSGFELASAILSKVSHAITFFPVLSPPLTFSLQAISIRGILCGSVAQFSELCKFIEVTKVKPVIDKVFPFLEAKRAFEHLESQAHFGKVVISVYED